MKKFKRTYKNIIAALTLWACGVIPVSAQLLNPTLSSEITDKAGGLGAGAGYVTGHDPGSVMARIIQAFLSLLGVIFISYIIYAGYKWMTAYGEEEKIRTAKKTIQRSVVGLIIVISAYSITYFVFKELDPIMGG